MIVEPLDVKLQAASTGSRIIGRRLVGREF